MPNDSLDGHLTSAKKVFAEATSTGWKAPKALTAALELHTGIAVLEPPAAPELHLPDTVDEAARLIAVAAEAVIIFPKWHEWRGDVLDLAARRLIGEVRAAGPSLVEHLSDVFNRTADEFTDVAQHLPARMGRKQLGTVDGATHTYYERALVLHRRLEDLRMELGWLDGTPKNTVRLAEVFTSAEGDEVAVAAAAFGGNFGVEGRTELDPWHALLEAGLTIGRHAAEQVAA